MGHKITRRRGDVKEREAGTGYRGVSVLGHKIIRRRGDVKERRAETGFRRDIVWATKSPGGEVA